MMTTNPTTRARLSDEKFDEALSAIADEYKLTVEDVDRLLRVKEVAYLHRLPAEVPAGSVLVHNHVYPVARRGGVRGSRFWLITADEDFERLLRRANAAGRRSWVRTTGSAEMARHDLATARIHLSEFDVWRGRHTGRAAGRYLVRETGVQAIKGGDTGGYCFELTFLTAAMRDHFVTAARRSMARIDPILPEGRRGEALVLVHKKTGEAFQP